MLTCSKASTLRVITDRSEPVLRVEPKLEIELTRLRHKKWCADLKGNKVKRWLLGSRESNPNKLCRKAPTLWVVCKRNLDKRDLMSDCSVSQA